MATYQFKKRWVDAWQMPETFHDRTPDVPAWVMREVIAGRILAENDAIRVNGVAVMVGHWVIRLLGYHLIVINPTVFEREFESCPEVARGPG